MRIRCRFPLHRRAVGFQRPGGSIMAVLSAAVLAPSGTWWTRWHYWPLSEATPASRSSRKPLQRSGPGDLFNLTPRLCAPGTGSVAARVLVAHSSHRALRCFAHRCGGWRDRVLHCRGRVAELRLRGAAGFP